ncbi:hypothetical protein U1Q18_044615, partial [Sarracenia purpurea var. burkii]
MAAVEARILRIKGLSPLKWGSGKGELEVEARPYEEGCSSENEETGEKGESVEFRDVAVAHPRVSAQGLVLQEAIDESKDGHFLTGLGSAEGRDLDPYPVVSSDLEMIDVNDCKLERGSGGAKAVAIGEDASEDSGIVNFVASSVDDESKNEVKSEADGCSPLQ